MPTLRLFKGGELGLHLNSDPPRLKTWATRRKTGLDNRHTHQAAKPDTDARAKKEPGGLKTTGLLDSLHFSRVEDPTYMAAKWPSLTLTRA